MVFVFICLLACLVGGLFFIIWYQSQQLRKLSLNSHKTSHITLSKGTKQIDRYPIHSSSFYQIITTHGTATDENGDTWDFIPLK
jgi:hypothetical protein